MSLRRRDFMAGLGGAAVWPLAGRGQQPAVPVIGFLHIGTPLAAADDVAALREGLGQAGYIEGRSLAIEFRFCKMESIRCQNSRPIWSAVRWP